MNGIDLNEARIRATDAISKLAVKEQLGDLMIVEAAIVETEEAWYFPYDAVAFVLHGNISAALAGNLPVRVPKDGSALSFEAPSQR
jgi:hypothetical protein